MFHACETKEVIKGAGRWQMCHHNCNSMDNTPTLTAGEALTERIFEKAAQAAQAQPSQRPTIVDGIPDSTFFKPSEKERQLEASENPEDKAEAARLKRLREMAENSIDRFSRLRSIPDAVPIVRTPTNIPLLYDSELSVIAGAAGVGKSSVVALIVAELIRQGKMVLYTDTEQNERARKRNITKIEAALGAEAHRIDSQVVSLSTLGKTSEDAKDLMKFYAEGLRPDAIIVDNGFDLVTDPSEVRMARDIFNECVLRILDDLVCCGVVVLHNARTTGKIEGHMGSMALKKASIHIDLQKKPQGSNGVIFTIEKNRYAESGQKASASFDSYGCLQWDDSTTADIIAGQVHAQNKQGQWGAVFAPIGDGKEFPAVTQLTWQDAQRRIARLEGHALTERGVKTRLQRAVKDGILLNDKPYYVLLPDAGTSN